jgi:hypothetical protein
MNAYIAEVYLISVLRCENLLYKAERIRAIFDNINAMMRSFAPLRLR